MEIIDSIKKQSDNETPLWLQARMVFENLLDLNKEQQIEYLEQACENNLTLKTEVISLLTCQQKSNEYIQKRFEKISAAHYTPIQIGQFIQGYQLKNCLGHGGMGAVYLAERIDGAFNRKVAIKLIHCAADETSIINRFRRERHILASLNHKNITQLLDAGATEDGTLYYVMEYVQGHPIDQYCTMHELSIEARLKLFIKVCAAVSVAHQKLILHRDLKPNNILVTTDGEPKLLDFGIAQFLSEEGVDKKSASTTSYIMTPLYSSPEQIRKQPLTTASDQYSLGVLLYQLLTLKTPYPQSENLSDLEKHIIETLPNHPSSRLDKKSGRRLIGDLDNIALKALSKEAQRRYPSVPAFAEDLQSHLNGLPVIARKSTLLYRANKYIARNKLIVLFSTAFAITIISLISLDRYRLSQLASEQQRIVDQTQMASRFLIELFTVTDASDDDAADIDAIKVILSRGEKRLKTQFSDKPSIRAKLSNTMGNIYFELGMFPQSLQQFQNSLTIYRDHLPNQFDDIANALNTVAVAYRQLGQYDKAIDLFEQSINIWKTHFSKNRSDAAVTAANLGGTYRIIDQNEHALKYFHQSIEIFRKLYGEDHPYVGITHNHIGLAHDALSNIDQAIHHFQSSVNIFRKIKPEQHPDIAVSELNLGGAYRRKGNHTEAKKLLENALSTFLKNYGEQHPHIANTFSELGQTYYDTRQYDTALEYFNKALSIRLTIYDNPHKTIAKTHYLLGIAYQALSRRDTAIENLQKALDVQKSQLGLEHSDTKLTLKKLNEITLRIN